MFVNPEAVAYDQIARVPSQEVIAAAPLALLVYALFGTSRQVVVGSTSSIATLNAAIIASMAAELSKSIPISIPYGEWFSRPLSSILILKLSF